MMPDIWFDTSNPNVLDRIDKVYNEEFSNLDLRLFLF